MIQNLLENEQYFLHTLARNGPLCVVCESVYDLKHINLVCFSIYTYSCVYISGKYSNSFSLCKWNCLKFTPTWDSIWNWRRSANVFVYENQIGGMTHDIIFLILSHKKVDFILFFFKMDFVVGFVRMFSAGCCSTWRQYCLYLYLGVTASILY